MIMTGSYEHKINKKRLMQYYFRVFQNYSDIDHFGSAMDKRTKLIGHTAVGLLVDTGWIDLIR